MPSLRIFSKRDGAESSPFDPGSTAVPSTTEDYDPSNMWIVGVTVTCAIFALLIFGGLALFLYKRYQYRQERKRRPYITLKEFSRRSKLTGLDRWTEDEIQRSMILRKSLATRSSSSLSPIGTPEPREEVEEEEEGEERQRSSLRDEWKEWEARMQMERSKSVNQHPLESAVNLASRDRSPPHGPLLKPQPASPLPADLSGS